MVRQSRTNLTYGRLFTVLVLSTGIAAWSGAAVAQSLCGYFNFPKLSDTDRSHLGERALAKVYVDGRYQGVASVISRDPLLLVTASHVVRHSASAQIAFPGIIPESRYEAQVLARAQPGPIAELFETSAESDEAQPPAAYDFAVLNAEASDVAEFLKPLEVGFPELAKDTTYYLAGFQRDLPSPQWQDGKVAPQDADDGCRWQTVAATIPGDSGGIVVNEEGLLVGLLLRGRESAGGGSMAVATILPLQCVREILLAATDHLLRDDPSDFLMEPERRRLELRLRPTGAASIDNLSLARSLRGLKADRERLLVMRERDFLSCPVVRASLHREVGWSLVNKLIDIAVLSAQEVGDELKQIGDQFKQRSTDLASRAYRRAATAYKRGLVGRLPEFVTLAEIPEGVAPDVPVLLRGKADALAALGEITGDQNILRTAANSAAQAAALATPGTVRGGAFATLANSRFRLGDYQGAIEAYSAAAEEGFVPKWVQQDYLEAFRRRDNVTQPGAAVDFHEIGAYPIDSRRVFSPDLPLEVLQ